jgi:hypothetical protein
MLGTATWCSRASSGQTANPRSCSALIKNGNASTLTVVDAVKQLLDVARAAAPAGMVIKSLFARNRLSNCKSHERAARQQPRRLLSSDAAVAAVRKPSARLLYVTQ